MADPLKSDEIEDVLSSIRRLVSEAHTAPNEAGKVAEDASENAAQADRLMLTPALRVTEPEDPWVPVAANALAHDDAEAPDDPDLGDGADWASELWGETRSEPDAEASPIEEAAETPEHPSEAPQESDVEAVIEALFVEPEPQPEEPEGDAAGLDENGDLISEILESELSDTADASEDVQAEADAENPPDAPISFIRSTKSVSDYEPEEGNTDWPVENPPVATRDLAEARGAVVELQAAEEEVALEEHHEVEQAHEADNASEDDDQGRADAENEAGDVDLAAEEDRFDDPSGATDGEYSEPEVAEDAASDPVASDVEDLGDEPFSFPDEGDSFVDEDALRELISEVVREELQGELGVRITRNIRKLVRREIRIALAAEELE